MQNPFVFGRPIWPDEPFCDREKEIKDWAARMENGEPVVIMSPRRYGKTSIMRRVEASFAQKRYAHIWIDLMRCASIKDFIRVLYLETEKNYSLAKKFFEKGKRSVRSATRLRPGATFSPADGGAMSLSLAISDGLRDWPTLLEDALNRLLALDKTFDRIAVFFDEFQDVRRISKSLDDELALERVMRSVLQYRSAKVSLAFMGSMRHLLQNIFLDEAAPFYRSSSLLELGPLPLEPYEEFINGHFGFKDAEDRLIPWVIWKFFDAHPHAVIKTASFLWSRAHRKHFKSNEVRIDAVADCIADVLTGEIEFYLERNRRLSPQAILFLREVAHRHGSLVSPYGKEVQKATGLSVKEIQNLLPGLQENGHIRVRQIFPQEGKAPRLEIAFGDPLEKVVYALSYRTEPEVQVIVRQTVEHLWREKKKVHFRD